MCFFVCFLHTRQPRKCACNYRLKCAIIALPFLGCDGLQYTSLAGLILCKKLYCYSLLWLVRRTLLHVRRSSCHHLTLLSHISKVKSLCALFRLCYSTQCWCFAVLPTIYSPICCQLSIQHGAAYSSLCLLLPIPRVYRSISSRKPYRI